MISSKGVHYAQTHSKSPANSFFPFNEVKRKVILDFQVAAGREGLSSLAPRDFHLSHATG